MVQDEGFLEVAIPGLEQDGNPEVLRGLTMTGEEVNLTVCRRHGYVCFLTWRGDGGVVQRVLGDCSVPEPVARAALARLFGEGS